MPVDIQELLINCAAAFGIGVLWYEFVTKRPIMVINFQSEDKGNKGNKGNKEAVSSGDSSENRVKATQMPNGDWKK